MPNTLALLHSKFQKATLEAFPQLSQDDLVDDIAQSTQDKFGHYQFNAAMKLAKPLKRKPRDIAQAIVDKVEAEENGQPCIENLEIAGPGFVNITLDPSFLTERANALIVDPRLGISKPANPKKVIVEFSSPNTAKELHVGHLRSTIIGDCLARLFEFLGENVVRLNHVGDWGTAFGMLIAYIKDEHPGVFTGEEETDLSHLVTWYKASKKRFDSDEDFKSRSRLEVVALQGGDTDSLKAWEVICEISRKAYQEIYDLLDVHIEERGESFYNPLLPGIIEDLESKGLVTVSNGAKCVFVEGFKNRDGDPLPLMVQKSDGGYNYDTTDMAAIRHRCEEEKADRIIYITDLGQATHFAMVFKAAQMAGYYDPKKQEVTHIGFGLVLGPDGKKFSTRAGETERLIDLLTTAVDKAEAIISERDPEMPQDERKALAKALGIGAVKYADLASHRASDYTFSYDRMLRFDGNTAAFLMYAYVRVAGIKRKIDIDIEELIGKEKIALQHPSEIALGLHLTQFSEALNTVAHDLIPNRLTDYLYELANKFNAFFRDCRVEGTEEQSSRLLLCELTARTLKQGLHILGIETVEKM